MRALLFGLALLVVTLPAHAQPLVDCLASENPGVCLPLVDRASRGDLEAAEAAAARAAASLRDATGRDAALLALAPSAAAFAAYVERECVRRRLFMDAGTGAGDAELACRAELRGQRAERLWGEVGGRPEMADLDGREWRLALIDGQPVLADTEPSLAFVEPGRAAGQASTNRWFAGYVRSGVGIAFGAAGSTMMFDDMPPGRMAQEQRFLQLLGAVDRLHFEDGRLELFAEGRPALAFE